MYIDEKNICIYTNSHACFAKLKINENHHVYLDEYSDWTLGHILQDAIFNRSEDSVTSFYTKLCLNQTIKQIKQNKYFISAWDRDYLLSNII